jgi:hypothetical protein
MAHCPVRGGSGCAKKKNRKQIEINQRKVKQPNMWEENLGFLFIRENIEDP